MGMSKTSLARVISACTWGLPDQVRSILNKYESTLLIPGVDGALRFGFQPGNYRESTGQTLAAADQQVGLVVDAAQAPGPELIQVLNFASSSQWDMTNTASFTANTWSMGSSGGPMLVTVPGKTYSVSFPWSATAYGTFALYNGTGIGAPVVAQQSGTSGTLTLIFTAAANRAYFRFSAGGTVAAGAISVRELPGIHASQATSGFQPYLRRGLVNQLLWGSDLSQSAWSTKLRVSVSGATLTATETNGNGFLIGRGSATALGNTTAAFLLEKGTGDHCSVTLWDGTNGTRHWFDLSSSQLGQATSFGTGVTSIQASIAGLPDGRRIISFTASIPSGSPQFSLYPSVNSPTGFGCTVGDVGVVHAAATFQGTVTADQIIAAGGIPVTTTAPASSANGVQSWQFDGTDDRFSMTFPSGAGWNNTTIITARSTGAVTETGQNVEGTHLFQVSGHAYGRFYIPNGSTVSASDLATLQRFANVLSGYSV